MKKFPMNTQAIAVASRRVFWRKVAVSTGKEKSELYMFQTGNQIAAYILM